MITWIASYPKSGNTWVRAFLCSYFSSSNQEFNFKMMDNIPTFPHHYETNLLRKRYDNFDFNNVASCWKEFQEILIKKRVRIIKTHNALINFNGYDFTDLKNTKGVIHVIRDPRDVLISYSSHQNLSYKEMFLRMKNINNFEKTNDYKDRTLLTSWNNHYNSWRSFPKNNLLIRYEDLSSDPLQYFTKIIQHLNQIYNFKFDKKKIERSIDQVKFENLKEMEKKNTFHENPKENIDEGKNFFRKGKIGQWKNLSIDSLIKDLEKEFFKEMRDNNYLD